MSQRAGPPPLVGLVAALVVLVGGIAAALSHDDTTSTRTAPGIVASTQPLPASTSTTRATLTTLPPSSVSTTSTTVRPAVPTPEAAANGLWAAYSSGNRSAASRFASTAVADAVFETPFSGDNGTFQGCRKQSSSPSTFACQYDQSSAQYSMTAQADAMNSFKIVMISITTSNTSSSSTATA